MSSSALPIASLAASSTNIDSICHPSQDINLTGVDPNTQMLPYLTDTCTQQGFPSSHLTFTQGVAEALPLEDESQDVVISTLVSAQPLPAAPSTGVAPLPYVSTAAPARFQQQQYHCKWWAALLASTKPLQHRQWKCPSLLKLITDKKCCHDACRFCVL